MNTTPRTPLATRVVPAITASEIAAYREVVRAGLGAGAPLAGPPKASPVHAYVIASQAFDDAIAVLDPDGADQPEPPRVHLGQEIHLTRPVRADEQITIELDALGARPEPRGVRLTLRSVLVGADGAPFAEMITGVLLVGAAGPAPFGEIPPFASPAAGEPGEAAVAVRRISTETVRRYAQVSGDDNPIHLDPEAARTAGFPGVIAHGVSVLALVCEEIIDRYAGGDAAGVRAVAARFSAPVLPGEPLEINLRPDRAGGTVRFTCTTPQGTAMKGGWVALESRPGIPHTTK
jgi:acyl dehydratase